MIAQPADQYQDIRDAVRALCAQFPDDYHRRVDEQRAYPEEFVEALTREPLDPGVPRQGAPHGTYSAADTALRASVLNTGQACQSIERVYVARQIAGRHKQPSHRAESAVRERLLLLIRAVRQLAVPDSTATRGDG